MASLRTTCPACHVMVDLHPDGVLAVAISSDTAQYSFVCPSCGEIADRTADDVLDLHLLLATDTWFPQLTAAARAHP